MRQSAASIQLLVNGLAVQVVRKTIKHLHVRVLPPDGLISVSAPRHLTDEQICRSLLPKVEWLNKHRQHFLQHDGHTGREFISGESHWFRGKRYRLEVLHGQGKGCVLRADDGVLQMTISAQASHAQRAALLDAWYRQQLKALLPPLLIHWQTAMSVQANGWGIKKMRTRWGSCNTLQKRIWLNLELAKKPPQCLEYVLVHELVHLLERTHNARFYAFMDHFLPDWRQHRLLLNE